MSMHDPSDKAMMDSTDMLEPEAEIETRIRALRHIHQRLMFSDLAEALPDCTWQILFGALSRLSKLKHVELIAHRWDYEVIFLSSRAPTHHTSLASKADDRGGHDERTNV